MPDYVCPECGDPLMQRAVLIEGTLMHYTCHLKLKAKARTAAARRVDAFLERRRHSLEEDDSRIRTGAR